MGGYLPICALVEYSTAALGPTIEGDPRHDGCEEKYIFREDHCADGSPLFYIDGAWGAELKAQTRTT